MSGDDSRNNSTNPLSAVPQLPTEAANGARPSADDIRAVVLAVYHDPARFKPLMQASSPVPSGFTELLRSLSGGAFSDTHSGEKTDPKLAAAALFYLDNVLLADPDNYYRILALPMEASAGEIQHSYSVMRQFLSRNGASPSGRQLELISKAYVTLNDPKRRQSYDRSLLTGKKS